jgi:hypothetical protein
VGGIERVHRLAEPDPVADHPQAAAVSAPSVISCVEVAEVTEVAGEPLVVHPVELIETCSSWPDRPACPALEKG